MDERTSEIVAQVVELYRYFSKELKEGVILPSSEALVSAVATAIIQVAKEKGQGAAPSVKSYRLMVSLLNKADMNTIDKFERYLDEKPYLSQDVVSETIDNLKIKLGMK